MVSSPTDFGGACGCALCGSSEPIHANVSPLQASGSVATTGLSLGAEAAGAQISRLDRSWGTDIGDAAEITFAFRSDAPIYTTEAADVTRAFERFTSEQIEAVLEIVEMFEDVAGLTLTRAAGGSDPEYSNDATILFGAVSSGPGYAFAYLPDQDATDAVAAAGDVWINTSYSSASEIAPGEYGYFTLIHELGHAVGLAHPGDYDASLGTPNYWNDAVYLEDTQQYTVMSYFSSIASGSTHFDSNGQPVFARTPLIHDIAALQRLYGVNHETRAGDTTYGFNSNAGSAYTLSSSIEAAVFAIWDGAGNDTLDVSGYHTDSTVSLAEESFSSVNRMKANISIAAGAEIENAITGRGNDTITGNALDNRLTGNAGHDTMAGHAGADVLKGGDGRDRLSGGAGDDQLIGGRGADQLTGSSGRDKLYGGADNDTLWGGDGQDVLEGGQGQDLVDGGAGADRLSGDGQDDVLNGGDGSDRLFAGAGRDTLRGDAGNDLLMGDAGSDLLLGGAGRDTLKGGSGQDDLIGGRNGDKLSGNQGRDTLNGQDGHDLLKGGSGGDVLNGGSGRDVLRGDSGHDTLKGGAGADQLHGGGGKDILSGGDGNDWLAGKRGNDILRGNDGKDELFGRSGNDRLEGGADSDQLTGGSGADRFVYTRTSDSGLRSDGDRITDFGRGKDKIDLRDLSKGKFDFIGARRFDGDGNGEVRQSTQGDDLRIVIDRDGDGSADMTVLLLDTAAVERSDFLL